MRSSGRLVTLGCLRPTDAVCRLLLSRVEAHASGSAAALLFSEESSHPADADSPAEDSCYRTEPATPARQCRARPHAAGTTRQSPIAGRARQRPEARRCLRRAGRRRPRCCSASTLEGRRVQRSRCRQLDREPRDVGASNAVVRGRARGVLLMGGSERHASREPHDSFELRAAAERVTTAGLGLSGCSHPTDGCGCRNRDAPRCRRSRRRRVPTRLVLQLVAFRLTPGSIVAGRRRLPRTRDRRISGAPATSQRRCTCGTGPMRSG